jgi:hypothetical protein
MDHTRRLVSPLLVGLTAMAALPLSAQTITIPDDGRGFSYFMGAGVQRTTYQESARSFPITSKATATSPLLITGAVYAVGPNSLISLDSESTFAADTVTETWRAPLGTVLPNGPNKITVTDPVLQTNQFSYQQNTLRLLWQQRATGPLFVIGGPAFHSHSFKRFGFTAGTDNATNIVNTTIEESASELMLNLGVALESERVRSERHHYSLRAVVAAPAWRKVTNTASPNVSFTGTNGYDLSLSGRYSLALHPNLHLGFWGQFQHGERGRQTQGSVELPESRLRGVSYGIELLWKL